MKQAAVTRRPNPKATPAKRTDAYAPDPKWTGSQAVAVGRFVRRSAHRIAAEIADAAIEMEGLILVVDGDDQAGLHDLRMAFFNLRESLAALSRAVQQLKVRGEQGHSDE